MSPPPDTDTGSERHPGRRRRRKKTQMSRAGVFTILDQDEEWIVLLRFLLKRSKPGVCAEDN
jgi:hypothetical protein